MTNKTKEGQPTQSIEIPGGQGATFKIDLLHEDEWAEELVTHMDEGFNSWEEAGEHLFSGNNMWSSGLSGDDDFVSTIAFHNIDGISSDAGINESLLDHLRSNASILCIGDTRTDARNVSRKVEVSCLAKFGVGLKRIDSWSENTNMRVDPQIGETAIVVRPDVALWTNDKIPDERALGRYCATVLRGKLDKTAHSKTPTILLITLYAPIHSNGENSAWIEQGKYIDKHNICDNQKELLTPFELLIEDLSALIIKHPNKEVIIGGDFNVNFEKKSHAKHQRILLDFAENHNLLNVLEELHPLAKFKTYSGTDDNDTCRTHIDHVYASGTLLHAGAITRAGVLNKLSSNSRHHPTYIEIDWTAALNRTAVIREHKQAVVKPEPRFKYINDPKKRLEFSKDLYKCIKESDAEQLVADLEKQAVEVKTQQLDNLVNELNSRNRSYQCRQCHHRTALASLAALATSCG